MKNNKFMSSLVSLAVICQVGHISHDNWPPLKNISFITLLPVNINSQNTHYTSHTKCVLQETKEVTAEFTKQSEYSVGAEIDC